MLTSASLARFSTGGWVWIVDVHRLPCGGIDSPVDDTPWRLPRADRRTLGMSLHTAPAGACGMARSRGGRRWSAVRRSILVTWMGGTSSGHRPESSHHLRSEQSWALPLIPMGAPRFLWADGDPIGWTVHHWDTLKGDSSPYGQDHLHAHRRGAAARHLLPPADRRGLHLDRRRGGRDPRHLAGRPHPGRLRRRPARRPARVRTPSPSSASWPRRPRRTSSSCRTSRRPCPSSRRRSPS